MGFKMIGNVIKNVTIYLTRDDLVALVEQKMQSSLPDNAKVVFNVPGGGDWSNMDIEISAENPIEISYTITETDVTD